MENYLKNDCTCTVPKYMLTLNEFTNEPMPECTYTLGMYMWGRNKLNQYPINKQTDKSPFERRHEALFRIGKVKYTTPFLSCCLGKDRKRKKGRNKKRFLYNKKFNDPNYKSEYIDIGDIGDNKLII